MAFSEIEKQRYEEVVGQFIDKRRPHETIRDQVDLFFRIEGHSVIIYEIREVWNQRDKKLEIPIAKATFVQTTNKWKLYWRRADLKWHAYPPVPETRTIEEFLAIVDEDRHGCFWG